MKLLELWQLWRKYGSLFTLPNLDDSAAFRQWCGEVTGLFSDLADMTATTVDDAAADVLAKVVADDDSWNSFYTILTSIVDLVSDDDDDLVKADNPDVVVMAERVGIDPVTIISLVMMAARFIKWLRERREGE